MDPISVIGGLLLGVAPPSPAPPPAPAPSFYWGAQEVLDAADLLPRCRAGGPDAGPDPGPDPGSDPGPDPACAQPLWMSIDGPMKVRPPGDPVRDALPGRHLLANPYGDGKAEWCDADLRALAGLLGRAPSPPGELAAVVVPKPLAQCALGGWAPGSVLVLAEAGQGRADVFCASYEPGVEPACELSFFSDDGLYWGRLGGVPMRDLGTLLADGPAAVNAFMDGLEGAPARLAWTPLPAAAAPSPEAQALAARAAERWGGQGP